MKFMNKKRFASTVMAGVLTLSMATPAFAVASNTVIEGTYEDIPIAVSVPETGTAQINPYGLPVDIKKSDETKVSLVDQQITTQPLSLRNQGTIPLDVNASLAVIPKGDLAIGTKDTGKTIEVDLEVAGLNDDALKVATDSEALKDLIIDRFANDANWTGAGTLTAPTAAKGATTVTPAKSTAALATLGAATQNGDVTTYGAKSIALFRLKGDLAAAPVKADGGNTVDDPWKDTDGFTATVAFTFKPATKLSITVNATGGTAAANPSSAWEGTEVTLTATPTTAGQTATFVVKDAANKTITVTDGKFIMPDSDVTVTVSFA